MDIDELREIICDDQLPGVTYVLVWGQLDEESDGYQALSNVLFDHESAEDPDNAPARDLSNPEVRRGVFECAAEYDDVRVAFDQVLTEIAANRGEKP